MTSTGATTGEERPLTLRQEQKLLARRRLLSAAQAEFLEHGFVAASVESISARAGVSRQTFYQYFKNKHETLQALREEPSTRTLMALRELEGIDEPTREDITRFVELLITHHIDNQETYAIIMQAQAVDGTIFAAAKEARERFVTDLAGYLRRAGPRRTKSRARAEAMLLQAQVEYFCHLWVYRGWEAGRRDVVAALARTWHAAILGAPDD